MRLSFTTHTPEEITEGVRRLAEALDAVDQAPDRVAGQPGPAR
jgi:DNA-binding transcriptional MocR family regulator